MYYVLCLTMYYVNTSSLCVNYVDILSLLCCLVSLVLFSIVPTLV